MENLRKALKVLLVAVSSFCVAGVVAYVILWHFAGLDNLGPDEAAAAAMGAFAVIIKSGLAGVLAAVISAILVIVHLRRNHG